MSVNFRFWNSNFVFCPWSKSDCAVQLDKFCYVFWYTSSVENGKPFIFFFFPHELCDGSGKGNK